MLQKVRMHFILVAMAALVAVLALLEVFFYFTAESSIATRYDTIIEYIYDNGGVLTGIVDNRNSNTTRNEFGSLMSGVFGFGDQLLSPELQYQTRYFTADLDENGNVTAYNLSNIASVTVDEVSEFAQETFGEGNSNGFYDSDSASFTYKIFDNGNDSYTLIAIDTTSASWLIREISMYILLWGFIIILIFTLIVIFFSKQAIAPMAANIEKQKQFVTNASHELKTPVAIISANTELMEALSGKNEWTESNMRQVQRLSSLINDLVILARVDERQNIAFERINFSPIAEDTAAGFKSIAESQSKNYNVTVEPNVTCYGEERALREILSILTDNAVKYCDDGGNVSVSLAPRYPKLVNTTKVTGARLVISNTFTGGTKADVNKFFDRFYRSEESHNNKEKSGFGIGLSMAKELIERLGGKVTVALKDNTITFTVII